MPLFAALFKSIGLSIFGLIVSALGAKAAIRVTAALTLAGLYVASVVFFSSIVSPWMASVFNTSYGALLGLLFPPVAGTCLASLSAYWALVASYKYLSRITNMAVG
jgi:hypothetical protein